ncbi:alcohol dehydrogenase catalytic domain-containing protein [Phytohabitans kaempferiae]|uniref:Alcohol dehydrogenase catalytic domain-containing protein n=1 Tax=Phytohabitans kaempferiae TaxID=1620943 RepID=A0ABV6MHM5_9ACTN
MRAVRIDRHGGPEVLTVAMAPDPQPAAGEVLVRTAASSLNPVDWKTRAWDIGRLPATLGWDLATVEPSGACRQGLPSQHDRTRGRCRGRAHLDVKVADDRAALGSYRHLAEDRDVVPSAGAVWPPR